jgi:hypothetical protein
MASETWWPIISTKFGLSFSRVMPGQAAIAAAANAEMFSMTKFELVSRSIYVSRSEDRRAAAFATRQCVTMLSPMKIVILTTEDRQAPIRREHAVDIIEDCVLILLRIAK